MTLHTGNTLIASKAQRSGLWPSSSLDRRASLAMTKYRESGFTLVELITVIVLLAIIASIGTGFIVSSVESYNSTQSRTKLMNKSRQAMERITRQLRGAVPNSIQLSGGCISFLPLAGGGHYLNPVPDLANGAAASSTITTASYRVDFGTARYAIIGAMSATDIYGGGSSASLAATIAEGGTGSNLTLSAAKQWQRNSINRRFFLADHPQAFCIVTVGGESQLHFVQGNALSPAPSGTGSLMAQQVTGSFSLQAGTESRNAIIDIDLNFIEGSETLNLQQQVYIRNVP